MNRHTKSLTFEVPRRPEPMTFRVDRALERMEIEFMRVCPDEFRKELKGRIAAQLVTYIAETTQLLDITSVSDLNPRVRVEITFNDRGTYANWLPQERNAGIREGAKLVVDALPYGFNPGEVFE